jgi:CubicO group peptidase (beta-lactamase class C family)
MMNRELERQVANGHMSGAVVLIADRKLVRSVEALGLADIAAGRPMRRDTLFWIASMNKAITGTAMMMLVDAGKVGLDDPVSKYLPEFETQWLAVDHRPRHPEPHQRHAAFQHRRVSRAGWIATADCRADLCDDEPAMRAGIGV